ncbi:GIY-YIG nuclease family protein [Alteromonas lipolytica]|uniref:GIY-YIG domain-containing protein n=1 Tax=Alteromonas lipolytica TaxID=1856405 RepID=A0A1E8FED4_9ALTE|nr:GIY-YIG nuclease family protein [Alteromonas lipolytica]OFI33843.1 hypothetical protein BFC17_19945 [Alteromonas lipolytica]GGF67922.1 endonuclease [Alteromonas lipolytica]
MIDKYPAVYILTNQYKTVFYTGVTTNLLQRIYQHKMQMADGFSKKYGLKVLVYFEMHEEIEAAIQREKRLKRWRRSWKIKLIEQQNPNWRDLYPLILG